MEWRLVPADVSEGPAAPCSGRAGGAAADGALALQARGGAMPCLLRFLCVVRCFATSYLSACLQDVPDDLLGRILVAAGRQQAAAAAATCRRLHANYWSQPELWQRVCVAAGPAVVELRGAEWQQWLGTQQRGLQRIAGMVRQVAFASCEPGEEGEPPSGGQPGKLGWRIAKLLQGLEGSHVESLSFAVW